MGFFLWLQPRISPRGTFNPALSSFPPWRFDLTPTAPLAIAAGEKKHGRPSQADRVSIVLELPGELTR